MAKIRFQKGTDKIHIPFILTPFSPWQEQVNQQIKLFKRQNTFSKRAKLGFNITENMAELILYRY